MDTTWTYLFTKGSQTLRIFLNKKFELFIKENQLDATWSKLANLQEATNLSELNAVEAKKEVEVAKFNIDFIKISSKEEAMSKKYFGDFLNR